MACLVDIPETEAIHRLHVHQLSRLCQQNEPGLTFEFILQQLVLEKHLYEPLDVFAKDMLYLAPHCKALKYVVYRMRMGSTSLLDCHAESSQV